MTTLQTPPADRGPATPPPSRERTAARVIAILTAALGALVIVVAAWGAVVPTVRGALDREARQTLPVPLGTRELDVQVSAAQLAIRFGDVDEATLDVRNVGPRDWVLERDGRTVSVSTPHHGVTPWLGGGNGRAVLTLPERLAGIDADLSLDGGALRLDGEFGALEIEVGAGAATLRGEADDLSVDVSAGSAEIDLARVRSADLDLDAGEITGRLTGAAPGLVEISVSAGSLDLTLPDDGYSVTSDVSAGDFRNDLTEESRSDHRVFVEVSAGSVRLRAL